MTRAATAHVVNSGSGTLTPINTATDKTGAAIRVASDPRAIAIIPNGKTVYVTGPSPRTMPVSPAGTSYAQVTIGP